MRAPRSSTTAAAIFVLLAGCAASIAIAWVASLVRTTPPPPAGPQAYLGPVPGTDRWSWFVNEHRGVAHAAYIFRKGRSTPPFPQSRPVPSRDPATLPRWAPIPGAGMKVDVHGFGWPWPCLRGTTMDPTARSTFLRLRKRAPGKRELRVPVEPIAGGLVADALVWGAAMSSVVAGGAKARAWSRRRRGRCARCNYDLRGTAHPVCPECGRRQAG